MAKAANTTLEHAVLVTMVDNEMILFDTFFDHPGQRVDSFETPFQKTVVMVSSLMDVAVLI